jgi:DNA/RNA endonuclease YhcR with UshA esterase domain
MHILRRITIALFPVLAATLLIAQSGQRGMHNYNPQTETTVSGTIQEVTQHPGQRGGTGTDLVVKTEQGAVDVFVGPTWYISKQGFSFAKGDAIEVTGSKTAAAGQNGIIAREIKKSGKSLTLREASGRPMWAGGPPS